MKEFCDTTGMTKSAVIHLCREGILKPSVNAQGVRDFNDLDLKVIDIVVLSRFLDYSLDKIKDAVRFYRAVRIIRPSMRDAVIVRLNAIANIVRCLNA